MHEWRTGCDFQQQRDDPAGACAAAVSEKASGGHPATDIGFNVSSYIKYASGLLHTSALSSATYIGISPIIFIKQNKQKRQYFI